MTIYSEIQAERDYQTQRWGKESDKLNTPFHWAAYINNYATRNLTGTPTVQPNKAAFRTSMVKVAALAVAAIEALDQP